MLHTEESSPRDDRQGIQSVEMAARVLSALETLGGPSTLGEIALSVDAQPNKVHRYLVSLLRVGLAIQSPLSGRYDLGPMIRRLGAVALRRTNDVVIASKHVRRLRDVCGHSVNIAVWGEQGPLVVRWDYGIHALPLTVRVGTTLSLLGSSSGLVFLSSLPRSMTAEALRHSLSGRHHPIAEPEIADIIASVQTAGVAVATGAVIPGASSMSAPVSNAADELRLAVTVVMPGDEVEPAEMDRVRRHLVATTHNVSTELGTYSPCRDSS